MARRRVVDEPPAGAAAMADALLSGEAAKGNVQTADPPLFAGISGAADVAVAPIGAPSSELFEMPMSAMAKSLSESGGLEVKIGHVARWTPEDREKARKWIVQKWDPMLRPAFLDAYVAKPSSVGPIIPPAIHDDAPHGGEPVNLAAHARKEPGDDLVKSVQSTIDAGVPPLFVNANKGPKITPDFARIIDTLYAADAFADYDDLERHLEVGEERGDYLTLRERLDKAEVRARRAHRLLLGAKLELFNWERDAELTMAAMRNAAHDQLQAEKDNGQRNKAITDADVVARIAQTFPGEYRTQETTRHKLKGAVSSIENLVERWNGRVFSIRTLLETLRK